MKAIILVSVLGIVAMLAEIFKFKNLLWAIAILGLSGILLYNLTDWNIDQQPFPEMVWFDKFAIGFTTLLIFLTIFWILISHDQYTTGEFNIADHYALILFALVGGIVMVSYSHMSMLFLGIEILSIPLYILAGSRKSDLASNESSLKYFMLGSFATGILLFGIALIYGASGSFNLREIAAYVSQNQGNLPFMFYSGVLLVMIGLSFKVSAVPFHFWTPDVYEGAPVLITAFMATVVKTAGLAAFYRLFSTCFGEIGDAWGTALSGIIIATILVGNILAVYQTSVKRMLAYSGISQAGYLLLAILVVNDTTKNALFLYLASYAISTLCAFAVLYHVIRIKGNDSFESFNSLGKTHPFLSLIITVSMLSLAGIPPAIGFFAKFYLFSAVLNEGHLALVIIAVIGSLISVYYYFRIIINMFAKEAEAAPSVNITAVHKTVLLVMALLIIAMGITPGLFIDKL